jgi:plastocyanin
VTVPRPSAIEAFDFRFQPAQLQARSGEQITLAVTNRGNSLHNVTVPSLEGAAIDVPPGQTKNLIFIAPAAGTLEFFCKYHRQQGMTGQIVLTAGSSGSLPFPVRRPPPDSANE